MMGKNKKNKIAHFDECGDLVVPRKILTIN